MCTRREVMSLPVYCENSKEGCKETPLWKNLKVCRNLVFIFKAVFRKYWNLIVTVYFMYMHEEHW